MRKVFLDNLPKNNKGEVEWCQCIGRQIHFLYEDIDSYIKIVKVKNHDITIEYNNIQFIIKSKTIEKAMFGHIINNIAASNPWMIPYYVDKNFPYNHTFATKFKSIMKCPYCGREKEHSSYSLYRYHHIPCVCLDKMSYPEKLFYCFLEEIGIDFEYQFSPKWGKIVYKNKLKTVRYDFLLPNNLIIETDGGWHIKDNNLSGQSKEESATIDSLKDEVAKKYGYKVIRIKCYESDFNYIKNEIINNLDGVLDISKADWEKIRKNSYSNLLKKVCDYKKCNPELTTFQIGKIFHLSNVTVLKYLKIGTEIGWCEYNASYETYMSGKRMKGRKNLTIRKDRIIKVDMTNGEKLKEYDCLEDVDRDGYDGGNVAKCCKGEYSFCYGFLWFYEKDYLSINVTKHINSMRRKGWSIGVKQYDLNGNLLKEYGSIMDAERETGIPNTNIVSACRGKRGQIRAGQYMWKYSNEGEDKIKPYRFSKRKAIYKFDLFGNILKRYDSVTEASNENKITIGCIAKCCRGEQKTAGSYIWKYANEVENNTLEEVVNE